MAAKEPRAGGRRRKRGRPPAPPETVRRNRVATFLTDAEFGKLERIADEKDEPLSAVLYEILARSLKRRK